jgi:hypothetical protein
VQRKRAVDPPNVTSGVLMEAVTAAGAELVAPHLQSGAIHGLAAARSRYVRFWERFVPPLGLVTSAGDLVYGTLAGLPPMHSYLAVELLGGAPRYFDKCLLGSTTSAAYVHDGRVRVAAVFDLHGEYTYLFVGGEAPQFNRCRGAEVSGLGSVPKLKSLTKDFCVVEGDTMQYSAELQQALHRLGTRIDTRDYSNATRCILLLTGLAESWFMPPNTTFYPWDLPWLALSDVRVTWLEPGVRTVEGEEQFVLRQVRPRPVAGPITYGNGLIGVASYHLVRPTASGGQKPEPSELEELLFGGSLVLSDDTPEG